jgi:hypothetical protein
MNFVRNDKMFCSIGHFSFVWLVVLVSWHLMSYLVTKRKCLDWWDHRRSRILL